MFKLNIPKQQFPSKEDIEEEKVYIEADIVNDNAIEEENNNIYSSQNISQPYIRHIRPGGIEKTKKWFEKDMHPLVIKFINESPLFEAYGKTIDQSASSNTKRGLNEWDHPDIVAVEAQMFLNFDIEVNNFLKNTNQSYMKIYSFELKQKLDLSNLRKYYFQAVSNSSWANEGYLVAMSIDEKNEEDIKEELKRLNNSFGIGVIILNSEELKKSEILFRSKQKEELDTMLINKLITKSKNVDFIDFIQAVNAIAIAQNNRDINKDRFDKVLSDVEMSNFIREKCFNEKNYKI